MKVIKLISAFTAIGLVCMLFAGCGNHSTESALGPSNVKTSKPPIQIYDDFAAPVSTVLSPVNNATFTRPAYITGCGYSIDYSNGIVSGVASVKYSLYNSTYNVYWLGNQNETWGSTETWINASFSYQQAEKYYWNIGLLRLSMTGDYILRVKAKDKAGNTENPPVEVNFRVNRNY